MSRRTSLVALLLLLSVALSSSVVVGQATSPPPKKSDPLTSSSAVSDFRSVGQEDLLFGLHRFSDQDDDASAGYFTEMLIDVPRYQLVVGGRDALYRLSLDGLTRLEKAVWEAKPKDITQCTNKGQSDDNCRNFVKVLVSRGDQIFACGTNAYSPKCSWRAIEEINRVNDWIDGKGKCPHSPLANSTAYMTSNGDYYIGSSTDFSSNDFAIYRMSGSRFENVQRTVQYNPLWLAQSNFVGTFETDKFMYFLFRETAVEHINCGKAIYSRIARVCKDDRGGTQVLKNAWTTFLKARLNCSIPGEYPFYFNEIQSMFYLQNEGIVYATFSTGENSIAGSAICSFNMSAIDAAFAGPFKAQAHPDSTWGPVNDNHAQFQCDKSSKQHLGVNSREYQFVNDAVQSSTEGPMFQENLERYTHIAVEAVFTKNQDNYPVHVIFVATSEGVVKKLSYNTRNKATCLVEILRPFSSLKTIPIRNMKLLEVTNSLYIATQESVLQIPTQRCQRFRTERQCLNAMDPYCGWNKQKEACTQTPNKNPRAAYFQQDLLSCPVLTYPIDGDWSSWSEWFQCDLNNPDKRIDSTGEADLCMCRRRNCDNPSPANGGQHCFGRDIEVTNCTQDGQWTLWSDWSSCSKSCDIGMRQRKRTCGNPAVAFGGRVCIGRDIDSQYCNDQPPCDASSASLQRPAGQFSEWTTWSKCSADCGSGFKFRTRKCYGSECGEGCTKDYKQCEDKQCAETMKYTEWTPWIKGNMTANGAWSEKRFSFSYQAPVSINQLGRVNEEDRFCRSEGQCSVTSIAGPPVDVSAQHWTEWSKCTRECGGGYQIRAKDCSRDQFKCNGGITVTERSCNTQPCLGEWGCWSEWTTCDSSGKRRRQRECKSHLVVAGSAVSCEGGSSYEEMDCDGWGVWGDWSVCESDSGHQMRLRSCLAEQCTGLDRQTRQCGQKDDVGDAGSAAMGSIALACGCGFLLGAAVGAALVYYFLVHRRPGGAHGSPHYVSAKSQNLYVSLPMLDLKHKHFSSNQSDCGTMRSTSTAGTLRSKASVNSVFGKPSDYETATIKRSHSHRNSSLINGNIRADLDSDQLFT